MPPACARAWHQRAERAPAATVYDGRTMSWLHDYVEEGDRAFFRPFGQATPGELADMTTHSLERAYAHGCTQALVNLERVYGFESPGPAYRRWIARRWARAVYASIDLVVVIREEHLLPERPGLVAAMEEGLRAHVCASEDEALAWLDAFAAVHH
jgi:hypothetical protein